MPTMDMMIATKAALLTEDAITSRYATHTVAAKLVALITKATHLLPTTALGVDTETPSIIPIPEAITDTSMECTNSVRAGHISTTDSRGDPGLPTPSTTPHTSSIRILLKTPVGDFFML